MNLFRSTHLEIPDREKGGIERKGNFINYFMVQNVPTYVIGYDMIWIQASAEKLLKDYL